MPVDGARSVIELQPIRPRSRDAEVLEHLARWVQSRGLRIDDRLPPERELAKALRVSRSTVREALKRWEALGLVEMRVRSGIRLKCEITPGLVHVGLSFGPESPRLLEVLQLRRALEGEAAAAAARIGEVGSLAVIERALLAMEAAQAEAAHPRKTRLFTLRSTGPPVTACSRPSSRNPWMRPRGSTAAAGRAPSGASSCRSPR